MRSEDLSVSCICLRVGCGVASDDLARSTSLCFKTAMQKWTEGNTNETPRQARPPAACLPRTHRPGACPPPHLHTFIRVSIVSARRLHHCPTPTAEGLSTRSAQLPEQARRFARSLAGSASIRGPIIAGYLQLWRPSLWLSLCSTGSVCPPAWTPR